MFFLGGVGRGLQGVALKIFNLCSSEKSQNQTLASSAIFLSKCRWDFPFLKILIYSLRENLRNVILRQLELSQFLLVVRNFSLLHCGFWLQSLHMAELTILKLSAHKFVHMVIVSIEWTLRFYWAISTKTQVISIFIGIIYNINHSSCRHRRTKHWSIDPLDSNRVALTGAFAAVIKK